MHTFELTYEPEPCRTMYLNQRTSIGLCTSALGRYVLHVEVWDHNRWRGALACRLMYATCTRACVCVHVMYRSARAEIENPDNLSSDASMNACRCVVFVRVVLLWCAPAVCADGCSSPAELYAMHARARWCMRCGDAFCRAMATRDETCGRGVYGRRCPRCQSVECQWWLRLAAHYHPRAH